MSYSISVISTKGGVGKSTLTKFLSIAFAELGKTVCVIDLCQNGSVPTGFLRDRDAFEHTTYDWLTGASEPSQVINQFVDSGIYFIPANETIDDFEAFTEKKLTASRRLFAIKEKIAPLKNIFDVIIFDTHPSENSDLVSYAIAASDFCLIPLETDLDSVIGAKRSVEIINEFMEMQTLDYGIVPNKVSQTNFKLRKQLETFITELVDEGIPEEKFLSWVRHSDIVTTSKNEKMMLKDYKNNKYAKKLIKDFEQVAKEVDSVLRKRGHTNG
ncbi:ParA family protein [Sporosarcina koreensis]|uniref:ParA family protein n=1 Tax=Sporosarcina koreensis TaxID=334735 RepID=A0ABW0TUP3_9BACL